MERAEAYRARTEGAAQTPAELSPAKNGGTNAASPWVAELMERAKAYRARTEGPAQAAVSQNSQDSYLPDRPSRSITELDRALKLSQGDGGVSSLQGYAKGAGKTTREALLESASNQKLKNAIDQIYRPGATTGDGGLADAIRHQLSTGELVGGKDHLIKGAERVKNLENTIKKEALSSSDLNLAQKLLNDLKSALGGK